MGIAIAASRAERAVCLGIILMLITKKIILTTDKLIVIDGPVGKNEPFFHLPDWLIGNRLLICLIKDSSQDKSMITSDINMLVAHLNERLYLVIQNFLVLVDILQCP